MLWIIALLILILVFAIEPARNLLFGLIGFVFSGAIWIAIIVGAIILLFLVFS